MSFRRVNRSKKVPGVKLRPVPANTRQDARTPDSAWTHSSGLDSDDETSRADVCPRPFKGFVLCATGIDDKTSLFKLALELGAQTINDLTDKVTHLIAEESGSAKYRCALECRIPIMHPSWIIESHKVWLRGDDVNVPLSIKQHRLSPFTGVVICVSGIDDVNRRMDVNREVTKAGGKYVKQLERPVRVTHLLCGNTSDAESEKVLYAQKFNAKGEARIHIVWEDWFWDSLRFGGRFNEEAYLVSNPRPPPRPLPEDSTPPPPSSTAPDDEGLSSEIQNAETSAARAHPPALGTDDEEIASGKRVPAVTLHLWQSILKPRGFEVQNGRLIRSPSKSQVPASAEASARAQRREGSPSRAAASKKLTRRGTLKDGDLEDEEDNKQRRGPISALSSFQRSRSFAPAPQNASTPRQPFLRSSAISRTSSFLQRPVGSIRAMGGMPSDVPIASTSARAGPSRDGSAAPDDALDANATTVSEAARTIFSGLRFRALGEARCASVKSAIEECGGKWVGQDDDDNVDFIVVRLVSGSNIFRRETDEEERAKFRTECWLERCIFEERVCAPEEHLAFTPLKAEAPIPGTDDILLSFSGLDHVEATTMRRVLRALGIALAPAFSRRSTHLLCPSGEGAKADKAREWGTPIVDMSWLATIAESGQIPPTQPVPARSPREAHNGNGDVLDLPAVPCPRNPEEWMASMASQPPAAPPKLDVKGKGKEKEKPLAAAAAEATMADITNAENAGGGPRAQTLSYYDPHAGFEACPGQAEQMEMEAEAEGFGVPSLLLGDAAPPPPPNALRQHSSGSHTDSVPPTTQPSEPSHPPHSTNGEVDQDAPSSSIPNRLYEDRVPSSASPSPLRLPPGARARTPHERSAPSTPAKLVRQAAPLKQTSTLPSVSLLGKRRSDDTDPPDLGSAHQEQGQGSGSGSAGFTAGLGKLQAQDSRVKRSRPLQRTRSNISCSEHLALTPGKSKGQSPAHSAAGSPAVVRLDPKSAPGGAGTAESGVLVAYTDPRQNGELDKLRYLLGPESAGKSAGKKEGVDVDMDADSMLPQLPDIVALGPSKKTGSTRGRGRRGRGRKSGR